MNMTFNEWWESYLAEGGRTHFNICANRESAEAAWNAAMELTNPPTGTDRRSRADPGSDSIEH